MLLKCEQGIGTSVQKFGFVDFNILEHAVNQPIKNPILRNTVRNIGI